MVIVPPFAMHSRDQRDLFVSVCGIDGAGKTTLIRRLQEEPGLPCAVLLPKPERHMRAILAEHLGARLRSANSMLAGPVAECVRIAYAFDFIKHYHTVIHLETVSSGLVFVDRWKLDVLAWAKMVPTIYPTVDELMKDVPDTDLTIVLDVDPLLATQRITSRDGMLRSGNQQEVLTGFREAYLMLARTNENLYVIDGTADQAAVKEQAMAVLRGHV